MKFKSFKSTQIVLVIILFSFVPFAYAQEIPGVEDSTEKPPEIPVSEENTDISPEFPGLFEDADRPGEQPLLPETDIFPPVPLTDNPEEQQLALTLTDEQKRIEREIKTSTLLELAEWCRRLGLSEGGDVNSLQNSLRNHYNIFFSPAGEAPEENRKIITIESARSTEYFKIEAVNEEYARLSGDVRVSLKDGDAVHNISAWEILFNRTRNIIAAKGGVEYKKVEGDKIETFRGDSITVNIDNWESIFLGGISERSLASDNTTYLFSGTVISRDEEDVTILTRGSISSAKGEESLWGLNASRIWLLPGSDFAIFNAVLKVGEIPVLYIPFFYFPADEVVFHPVIGYRSREGNYVQTTTYILGRRKTSSTSTSSLTKILGNSSDMEKKWEGLFLRSTGKPAVDEHKTNLNLVLDYYSNLGGYIGTDLLTPQLGILNAIDLKLGIGFSRTLVPEGNSYTPFAEDGTSDWNKSTFLSFEVPFRYRFILSRFGISGKLGSLSLDIPYYSDPWIESDFTGSRAEDMDWINMIQQGAAYDPEDLTNVSGTTGSNYIWSFNAQLTPQFPNMSPFINRISINGSTTSISFQTKSPNKTSGSTMENYSPNRLFYYPDYARLYSTGFSLDGTPLSLGRKSTGTVNPWTPDLPDTQRADPFAGIGVPRSPWESEKEEDEQPINNLNTLVPPVLSQRFDIGAGGTTGFTVDYSLAPLIYSEMKFDSGKWGTFNDINWEDITNILTKAEGNARIGLKFTSPLLQNTFDFNGNGTWDSYSYLNENASPYTPSPTEPDPVRKAKSLIYEHTGFTTSYNLTSSLSPFFMSSTWKNSTLSYSLAGAAIKSEFLKEKFLNSSDDNPEWEIIYGSWDKDKITTHSLSANFSASIMDKSQSLSFRAELPPKDSSYSANTTLNIWITQTYASMGVRNPDDPDKRKLDDFNLRETIKLWNFGTLTYSMNLDTEKNEMRNITAGLSTTKGLSANFNAKRSRGQELTSRGFTDSTSAEDTLRPENLSITYNTSFNKANLWKEKLSFGVNLNTGFNFNLQKYTYSTFKLGLGFTLDITNFLSLRMDYDMLNSSIYRYYRSLIPNLPPEIKNAEGEQYNVFTDLLNSFRFDDENRRKSSGFKVDGFRLSATHYLGDWDATLSLSMSQIQKAKQFEFTTDFSFLVRWIPISEIKSDITYNKSTDTWTVK